MDSVGVNKKSKLSLDGKLNFVYQIKKNPSFKKEFFIFFPFNFQDKEIILGEQSKNVVVVTLLFGFCSVVI